MAWHQGQAYGQDLRDRILNASGSIAQVANRSGQQVVCGTGTLAAAPSRG